MTRGRLTELDARLRAPVPLPARARPALSGVLLRAMALYVTARTPLEASIEMGIDERTYHRYLDKAAAQLGAHTRAEAAYLFGVSQGKGE